MKKTPGKPPIFSEQSLRELAELAAQEMLRLKTVTKYNGIETINLIEQILPARAVQIRQNADSQSSSGSGSSPTANSSFQSKNDTQKILMENVQSLGAKQLSKEEREKTIGAARKTIANIKEPTRKLLALSALALQISALGDRELAGQIMDEAKSITNLQPKNYVDFMQIWMLSSGYARVDAPKTFPILEDTIARLNETIAAFVKVGEFIDVGGEMIEDGEIQVGGFGSNLTRELTRNLAGADQTIRSLAKTDFVRTKGLTDKFDRAEVRILAKMLVLRSLFGNKQEKREE